MRKKKKMMKMLAYCGIITNVFPLNDILFRRHYPAHRSLDERNRNQTQKFEGADRCTLFDLKQVILT
jgi:hypothetical protein